MGEDLRLDEARVEYQSTLAQIASARRRWQSFATSTQVLETIRTNYEAQRQPETLREASHFLNKLTRGQYPRIWTKLVGDELLVDTAEKETLRVELLSRGTREAVYLSLRLALVGAYARRGAILPMVLDDVLVNFDAERARAAAKVLRDFATAGYQILLFTCHDHFRDLFHELGADVRVLPHHQDVVRTNAVPKPYDGGQRTLEFIAPEETDLIEIEPEEFAHMPPVRTATSSDELEPELQFEISAVNTDEQREKRLRDHLVYISEDGESEFNLADKEALRAYSTRHYSA